MAVHTMGGTWSAPTYEPLKEGSNEGCRMRLEFSPNPLANSNKIALVQLVLKNIKNGKNFDASMKQRLATLQGAELVKAMRTDGTGHLDRAVHFNNPVYGADNMASGTSVSRTPEGYSTLAPPQRSYRMGRTVGSVSASLHDEPMFANVQNGDLFLFETAAVSLDGPQKGVWYGSVTWGFEKKAGGIELYPLEVGAWAIPSPQAVGLLRLWNSAMDKQGKPNIQIFVPSISFDYTAAQLSDETFVRAAAAAVGQQVSRVGSDKIAQAQLRFMGSWLAKPKSVRDAGCR